MSPLSKKLDIIGPKALLLWLSTLSNVVPLPVNLSLSCHAFLCIFFSLLFLHCWNSVHVSLSFIWRGTSSLRNWSAKRFHGVACLEKVSLDGRVLLIRGWIVVLPHEVYRGRLLLQIGVVSKVNSRSVAMECWNRNSKAWSWWKLRRL